MAFGQRTPTIYNDPTGDRNIDSLISRSRYRKAPPGQQNPDEPPLPPQPEDPRTTVTFSFPNNFPHDYESDYNVYRGARSFTSDQKVATREIMDMYEAVANLNLEELFRARDRDATIRLANADGDGSALGITTLPQATHPRQGDIWIVNTEDNNNPRAGNKAYKVLMHEIGHALGLLHPHEGAGLGGTRMESRFDANEFTVMSYRPYVGADLLERSFEAPQTLMMYDIAAIQAMYGANFNTQAGNTTYSFRTGSRGAGELLINGVPEGRLPTNGSSPIYRTIWDGNGIDTYDFSNFRLSGGNNMSIDLRPGKWSDLAVGTNAFKAHVGQNNRHAQGHVYNALQYNGNSRSLIENAKGARGNDTIRGNDARNELWGNWGHDRLYGYNNNDTLHGDRGEDRLYGGTGDDTLYGGEDGDWLKGLEDNDTIYGEGDNDWLIGGDGNDYLNGGAQDDILVGVDSDSRDHRGEVDTLIGGPGRDRFVLGISSTSPVLRSSTPNIFYLGDYSNYAYISDFRVGEDKIQLARDPDANDHGIPLQYGLGNYQVNGVSGTGIFYGSPLGDTMIGFVAGIERSQLNLDLVTQFTWV